jgi:AcrR family transcriptional regulator
LIPDALGAAQFHFISVSVQIVPVFLGGLLVYQCRAHVQAPGKHMTSKRTAGQRIGINRQDIVRRAADLADQEGLAAVTLARLAVLFDVRTPTISHHVGSLQELRAEMAILAVEQMTEAVWVASTGKTGAEAVRSLYKAYRDFVLAHPGRYMSTLEAPDPRDERRLAAAYRLAEHLRDVLAQIGVQGEDAMRAGRLLRSAVHGYSTLELASSWQMPLDNDAAFEWMLDVILKGLSGEG